MSPTLTWRRVERRGFIVSHWESDPARFSIWQCRNRLRTNIVSYELMPGYARFPSLAAAKAEAQRQHTEYMKDQVNG
jgi:hypothetical protein